MDSVPFRFRTPRVPFTSFCFLFLLFIPLPTILSPKPASGTQYLSCFIYFTSTPSAMSLSLKAELEAWAAALKAYDEQDFEKALDLFSVSDRSQSPSPHLIHMHDSTSVSRIPQRSSPTWASYTLPLANTRPQSIISPLQPTLILTLRSRECPSTLSLGDHSVTER